MRKLVIIVGIAVLITAVVIIVDRRQPITSEKAVRLVMARPEVRNWMALFSGPGQTSSKTGGKAVVGFDRIEAGYWVFHLYEQTADHQATFNWYRVNQITGEVTTEF